jgi:RNA polymerase sigma-70 factor (ECF subfamily)
MLDAIPQLRAIALALCRNADAADDLVQETLLRGCSSIDSFQPGTNMGAWLAKILRNQFYSDCRRRRYRAVEPLEAHVDGLVTPASQHQVVEMRELQRALGRLRLLEQEAVVLVLLAGYSYEEAGEICGCPTGSIKSRVNWARKKLVEFLSVGEGNLAYDMDPSILSTLASSQITPTQCG